MKMLTQTVGLIFLIFISACDTKDEIQPIPKEQKVLFQYSYVNYAWGYTNQGWFIDGEGNVLKYDVDKTIDWNFSDNGFLTNDEMLENLSQATLTEIKVDEKKLQEMFNYIDDAQQGRLSESKSRGADMGVFLFSGYSFNANSNDYEHVFLSQSGDFSRENEDKKAKKITKWLSEINDKVN